MSQNDMTIINSGGLDVRQQIQLAIQALASNNSGAAEPTTTFPFMYWADEASDMLKLRNSANTGWVDFAILSTGEPVAVKEQPSSPVRNAVLNKEAVTQGQSTRAGFETILGTAVSSINDAMYLRWRKGRLTSSNYRLSSSLTGGKYVQPDTAAVLSGAVDVAIANDITWQWELTHTVTGETNQGKEYTCEYNPLTGISVSVIKDCDGVAGHHYPSHLTKKTELVYIKNIDYGDSHLISHESFAETEYMLLDTNTAVKSAADASIIHTDTGVTVGTNRGINGVGYDILVIQKHSVEGYSKIGIYNPSGVGFEVDCGLKVGWSMFKRIDVTTGWTMLDTLRSGGDTMDDYMYADLPNAESPNHATVKVISTSTGFTLAGDHSLISTVGGKYLYEVYADSSSDATHSQADYSYPTDADTLTIEPGTEISFAEGFDGGSKDTVLTIGNGVTKAIPIEFAGKKAYFFMNADGSFGWTDILYAEGKSREAADTWGRESYDGYRTTESHSSPQSNTGVVSSTSKTTTAGYEDYRAFDTSHSAATDAWVSDGASFSSRNANHARGYEALRYYSNQLRMSESIQVVDRIHVTENGPEDYTIVTSVDGIIWNLELTVTGELFAGQGTARPSAVIQSAAPWHYLEIRVTRKNSGASNYVAIGELRINTSAPKGDFLNVVDGIVYDSSDLPIQRAYLATVDVETDGGAAHIENYPVGRSALLDTTIYGLLRQTENVTELDFGMVNLNSVYRLPNPYGNHNWKGCTVEVFILVAGEWIATGWYTNAGVRMGVDVHSVAKGIVVVTGEDDLVASDNSGGGTPPSGADIAAALCIALVTFNGDTINA